MGPVILAKRNYGVTLITVAVIIINKLIATTNSIMPRTPLHLIISKNVIFFLGRGNIKVFTV